MSTYEARMFVTRYHHFNKQLEYQRHIGAKMTEGGFFRVFKVVAPTWPVMLINSDGISGYEDDVMKHFKLTKNSDCEDLEHLQIIGKIYLEDEHQTRINNDISELWRNYNRNKPRSSQNTYTNTLGVETGNVSKILTSLSKSYYKLFKSQKVDGQLEQEEQEIREEMECCNNYRSYVSNSVLCMRKREGDVRSMPFWIALFIPCFSCILVALIMAPLKRSLTLQRLLFTKSITEETCDENLESIKYHLQFFSDLLAFYAIIYNIQTIGYIMRGPCVQQSKCVPHYTSPQIVALLALAQAPWTSIVWNLVY